MRQNPRTPLGDWTPEQRTQFNRVAVFGLLGIVIGFFLATVVWPADRSGSRLDDLQPALRAQYLSALADAYVTTAGDNAATVLSRLTDLRDPQQELSDAIVYYQGLDSETAQLHEFNLRTLQAEFGGVAGVPGAAADTSDTPQATALDTAAETPVQRTLGRASLLDWLLIGVAMAMLIGGGVWIFYQFVLMRDTNRRSTRRRDLDEDDYLDEPASADSENDDPWDYDFDDDDAQRAAGIPRPPTREEQWENWNRRSQEVGDGPLAQPAPRQPTPQQQSFIPQQAQDWEDITVETDIDVASARRAQPQTDDDAASLWSATSAEGDAALTDDTLSDDALSDDALSDDALTDDAPDFDDTPPIAPQARQLPPKSAPGAPPARRDDAPDDIQNAGRETRRRPAPGQGDTQRPRPDAPPQDSHKRDDNGIIGQVQDHLAGFRRRDRAPQPPPVLTEFKATYYHGITDYEESFTVTSSPESADILGACGVGTAPDLDPQSASSDNVRVLDIWLYDKASMSTQNQLLAARGVDLDSLAQRRASSGTVTGEPLAIEPGTSFKLRADQLLLECQIESVSYLENAQGAPFQSVSLSLKVMRKS